ncbi:hypothetical protein CHU98_g4368 [Xylaria longipes]|nr:hypothetical protein CHU98_g4368 [Xylaria longipes]
MADALRNTPQNPPEPRRVARERGPHPLRAGAGGLLRQAGTRGLGGKRGYHAGDTGVIPERKSDQQRDRAEERTVTNITDGTNKDKNQINSNHRMSRRRLHMLQLRRRRAKNKSTRPLPIHHRPTPALRLRAPAHIAQHIAPGDIPAATAIHELARPLVQSASPPIIDGAAEVAGR